MMRKSHKTRAMTLVELLLAMTILAVLLGAAAKVLHVLRRSSQAVESRSARLTAGGAARAMLAADCDYATSIDATDGKLTMESIARLDRRTLDVKHLPSTVTYGIQVIDGRSWLVRSQRAEDEAPHVELVCRDVAAIDCEQVEADAAEAAPTENPPSGDPPAETQPAETQPAEKESEDDALPLIAPDDYVTITISFTDGSEDLTFSCVTFNQ